MQNHTRTRVAMLVTDDLVSGWVPDEICRQYPDRKLAEVPAAVTYKGPPSSRGA